MNGRTKNSFKQLIKARTDIFNFGKYKGQTVEFVLKNEPGYILWCSDEKIIKFSQNILDDAEKMDEEERYNDAMDGIDWGLDFGRDDQDKK